MAWLTVSLATMVLMAGLRLAQKSFVSHSSMNAFRLNWLTFTVGLPVAVAVIAMHLQAMEHLSVAFWLDLVAVVVGFYPAVNYLYFSVIRENELSSVLPLLGLIPVFTALFGWLLLGQTPTLSAVIGILAVSVSIYVLYRRPGKTWYEPLAALSSSKAAGAMFVVSLITAIAAIGDKFAIQRSGAGMYFALNTTGAFAVLALCDLIATRRRDAQPFRPEIARLSAGQWGMLASLGVLWTATQVSGFIATDISANTSYTVAIRNLNIVVASLAAVLLLNERVDRYKLFSYGLSALGVVMIAL